MSGIPIQVSEFSQWIMVISGFVIKPVYMIFSFVLIILLWRHTAREMVLIKWAMIIFLLGEIFCAINYLVTGGENEILEILHGLGMVGISILLPWGLFVFLDRHILNFSVDKSNCVLLQLCRQCWKNSDTTCSLKQLFLFLAPTLAVVSLMPLTALLKPFHYTMTVFKVETQLSLSFRVLQLELRVYPIIASILLIVSMFFLWRAQKNIKLAQFPFFIGLGFMIFSLFRFFLIYSYYHLPHWVNFWEEMTELIMIAGVGIFLIIFRKKLFLFNKPKLRKPLTTSVEPTPHKELKE